MMEDRHRMESSERETQLAADDSGGDETHVSESVSE